MHHACHRQEFTFPTPTLRNTSINKDPNPWDLKTDFSRGGLLIAARI